MGCGVYASSDAMVSFYKSLFTNNSASAEGGGFALEGSTTHILNSTFSSNIAEKGSALSTSNSLVKLLGSLITRNVGLITGTGVAPCYFLSSNVVVQDSNFTHNKGEAGGALTAQETDIFLARCQVLYNLANEECGGVNLLFSNVTMVDTLVKNNTSGDIGGGVDSYRCTITWTNIDVFDNLAQVQGGGVVLSFVKGILLRCRISYNKANIYGGGMVVMSASITTLKECIISYNDVVDGGGGIYTTGFSTRLTIVDSLIFKNTVTQEGGGLCVSGSGVEVINTTITENIASSAVFNVSSNSSSSSGNTLCSAVGGCIFSGNFPQPYNNNEECMFIAQNDGTLLVDYFNTEKTQDSLTVHGKSYSSVFGPSDVEVSAGDVLTWKTDNQIIAAGFKICFENAAKGGGVFISGDAAVLSIINSTIEDNFATRNGGGIYGDSGEVKIEHLSIQDNEALFEGYDLFFDGGTFDGIDLRIPYYHDGDDTVGGGVSKEQIVSQVVKQDLVAIVR
eukprot:CAMPEP_0114332900 /NCGR_PEP_ID=MMETSP0101-20121206/3408_1 /TAXON_ID=38822 ORGANISM="Pteridomonas danica, Strain PT" /NCGR_SAMPLE_ID=MMETSP0101 /ASSEMBLY_ACC=CAM_ASM_000211 /LENGTH=506 /DNA_ID=CAMNT_0001463763 /DNA_START=401 /DNA_END=1922 /DNA_ORIENTATION=+